MSVNRRNWQSIESAPKDRQILARRHNDVFYEHHVVWWGGDPDYPWVHDYTAFAADRLDEWCELPE